MYPQQPVVKWLLSYLTQNFCPNSIRESRCNSAHNSAKSVKDDAISSKQQYLANVQESKEHVSAFLAYVMKENNRHPSDIMSCAIDFRLPA